MLLDRRKAYEIARALELARNRGGAKPLEDVAQLGTTAGDRNPGAPAFEAESQFQESSSDGSQPDKLVPTPRPHPFRDPARFTYVDELADMAKAGGVPAYDQLAVKVAPGTLSQLANLQTAYGRPLEVDAAYNTTNHKKNGPHPLGKAFDLNVYPATNAERARVVELATQMGFVGTGTYQDPEDTKKGFNDPRVHIDVLRPRSWGHDTTVKTTPSWHRAAIARGLAAGEPDMEAIAAKVAKGIRYFVIRAGGRCRDREYTADSGTRTLISKIRRYCYRVHSLQGQNTRSLKITTPVSPILIV